MYYEDNLPTYYGQHPKYYGYGRSSSKDRPKKNRMQYVSWKTFLKLFFISFVLILVTNLYLTNSIPDFKLPKFPEPPVTTPDPVVFKKYLNGFLESMTNMPMDETIKPFTIGQHVEKSLKDYRASAQYYRRFSLSPPTFPTADQTFSDLFMKNPGNRLEMSSLHQAPMRGIVAVIPNGVFAEEHDCNMESSLTQYLSVPSGATMQSLESYIFPLNDLGTPCQLRTLIMEILPRLAQAKGFLSLHNLTLITHGGCDQYAMQILYSMGLNTKLDFGKVDAYRSKYQINSCISPLMHRALLKPVKELLGIENIKVHRASQVAFLLRLSPLTERRTVTNLDIIEETLNDRFPEVVIFQGSALLNEIRKVFEESNILIAVHGPVLYNVIYAQPNSQVVEIFATRPDGSYITDYGEETVNNIWRLCQVLGHRYYRMMEEPVGYLGAVLVNPQNFELMVDTLVADDDT